MATKISKINGGRIRKVTITEIENEEEWNWPDPGCFEEADPEEPEETMKPTEEVFEDLEYVVQDWKKKLEVIVAEGLRTIKKTTKEKKLLMKYLPGDGLIGGSNATLKARCQILTEWKDDITSAINSTHNKLHNLGNQKVQDTKLAVDKYLPPEKCGVQEENTCKTVSLDFETLMRDLDILYSKYSYINNNMNKVPIYNVQKDILNHTPFPWWKPMNNYAQMVNFPIKTKPEPALNNNFLALLQDFVSDQKSQKSIMQEWKKLEEKKKVLKEKKDAKTSRRGRDSIQKMKERREIRKYKQFLLREIVRKGETHYYVMKKEVEEPQNIEVEDIFSDWKNNLSIIKRPRSQKPRVRKISHRAERKEMLKEAKLEEDKVQGPKTYSQMLKKNLKVSNYVPNVEELVGPWMKNVEKMYKPSKATNAADEVEVFKNWNFIFEDKSVPASVPRHESLDCGQPTVPSIQARSRQSGTTKMAGKQNKKQTIEKLSAKLLAEGYPLGKASKADQSEEKQLKASDNSHVVAVRSKTEIVPYVEKVPFSFDTIPKIAPAAKDFKPSRHSQMKIVNDALPKQSIPGPVTKPKIPTPPPMPAFNWKELLATPVNNEEAPSGRGDKRYNTEEIFDQWRHIFTEANKLGKQKKTVPKVKEYKQDTFFMEWLRNLDEPVADLKKKARCESGGDKENKTPSPRISKKAERKQVRDEFIDEDVTDHKNNRRNDFAKNKQIKDRKRTEAARNSLGKRVK